MATYAERLAVLQGVEPEHLYVVTGDGESGRGGWSTSPPTPAGARARLRDRGRGPAGRPSRCRSRTAASAAGCDRCDRRVAGRRRPVPGGVHARRPPAGPARARHHHPGGARPRAAPTTCRARSARATARAAGAPGLAAAVGARARDAALRPAGARATARACCGCRRRTPGDLYLDFEGDPYAEGGEGREYLAGLGDRRWRRRHRVHPALGARPGAGEAAHDRPGRRPARRGGGTHPGMHVYHYAPYETTALKRLVGRHGVREAELDQLLRGERFVDLYAVVRQGMRISKGSYSIKKMEAFYWGHIRNHNPDVADAMSQRHRLRALVGRAGRDDARPRSRPTTATTSARPGTCTSGSRSAAASSRPRTGRSRGPRTPRTRAETAARGGRAGRDRPRRAAHRGRARPCWRGSCSSTAGRRGRSAGTCSASPTSTTTSSSTTAPPWAGLGRPCRRRQAGQEPAVPVRVPAAGHQDQGR